MSYGVNQWAALAGRARAAGSSKRKSTRTAKRKKTASARRAPKRSSTSSSRKSASKRRVLPPGWGGTAQEYENYQKALARGDYSQGKWN